MSVITKSLGGMMKEFKSQNLLSRTYLEVLKPGKRGKGRLTVRGNQDRHYFNLTHKNQLLSPK